jgi:hypothetical protein
LEKNTDNQENFDELEEKKTQLQKIREKRMQGVLLRSKARWVADGEKITKYFCNLEKRHYISKSMNKLINDNGITLTKSEDVAEEVNKFYENLYQYKMTQDCEIHELAPNIPTLNSETADSLEGEISLEEAGQSLKCMKNNKSPGSDGFSVEFFKFFWPQIGGYVVRALNTSFRKGLLSPTQRQGIITCIPKGEKDRHFIKNWRPISLLNVVYKIGSACIASRIKTVLPGLINEDQTGFMANRYIGDNIRLIYDVIAYLDAHKLPGLLINIDFEKAFDSLDWEFMFKVLKAFGFKEDICKWIHTFYNNIKSTVIVNGQSTKWFNIKRGCRQGDPISPYLFILCVEVLANMIRDNENIVGIKINEAEHKLSQYADDTELLLEGDQNSFESSFSTLETFGAVSGLKLNHGKTSIIWLGSKKNSNTRYMNHLRMDWNPPKFKVLGVWFTNDNKQCVNINFNEKFEEAKKLFLQWTKRIITPLGRVAILKSVILSKLTHLFMLLPNPPDHYIQNIQKICYMFVWNTKQDKISRKITNKSVKNGGLGIPDIKMFMLALKCSWIRKISSVKHKWKYVAIHCCSVLNKIDKLGPSITCDSKNAFWKDVLAAYENYFYKTEPNYCQDLLAEPIFFNRRILIDKSVVKYENWISNGVFNVSHFFKENGTFLTYIEFTLKYNINVNFLIFYRCQKSIRKFVNSYKLNIENNSASEKNAAIAKLFSSMKGARVAYDTLITNDEKPNCCAKWEEKLNKTFNWKLCFLRLHKIKDVNLKWFQARIIHRILGTNIILKSMNVATNDRCGFCGIDRDSIDHFLWKCNVAQMFWTTFLDELKDRVATAHRMTFTESLIILGIDENITIDEIFNLILTMAKQYLYKCKLDRAPPNVEVFRKKLGHRYNIEMYNSKINSSLPNFNANWGLYKDLCIFG